MKKIVIEAPDTALVDLEKCRQGLEKELGVPNLTNSQVFLLILRRRAQSMKKDLLPPTISAQ